MALSFAAVKTLFDLMKVAPVVRSGLRKWKGRPNAADRERLVAYGRRLDERRVFFVSYNVEVVESCVGSLDEVRRFTDEVLSETKHEGARAVLGAILDVTRQFNDRWHGTRTPHDWDHDGHRHSHAGNGGLANFFEDLGELRAKVRILAAALAEIEPDVSAPTLLGPVPARESAT